MSKTYREWDPDQSWLLPPSPAQWLPDGDMVYYIMDAVKQLDISEIKKVYERNDRGFPPFHPRMMVTLLIYSYCMGVRSSRQIALHCQRDIGWRVIVGNDVPDFRTINNFRKTHLDAFAGLFVQVLEIAAEDGLVKLGHVSLDGTKIKANASRHKAMSYDRMIEREAQLKVEIAEIMKQVEAAEATEEASGGAAGRVDSLPQELACREKRLARIQEAKAALEARYKAMPSSNAVAPAAPESSPKADNPPEQDGVLGDSATADAAVEPVMAAASTPAPTVATPNEVPEKAQYNFTDPESRIMKANNKGWDQCGNAQAVVDSEHQIIVAADVTDQANDVQQVAPMMAQAQANVGPEHPIEKASMDAGYFSEANVACLENMDIDAYVATGRLPHGQIPPPAPRGPIPAEQTPKQRMARKLRTVKGRAIYARRKAIVEPVFGQVKGAMGFRQFLLRGLGQMRGEWRLVCLSYNLRKMFRAKMAPAG